MKNLTMIFGPIVGIFFTDAKNGISISEVSRITAEHKQQNDKFWSGISDGIEGVFTKVVRFIGAGDGRPQSLEGTRVTPDQIKGYAGVAVRNSETAVLMHAVKLHKRLQAELAGMDLSKFIDKKVSPAPVRPERAASGTTCYTEEFMEMSNIDEMIASLSEPVLAKFDLAFYTKANELNSRAATLGKLLSERDSFFRGLVRPLPRGGEQVTSNGVVITSWKKSYSDEDLGKFSALREELQSEYNSLQKELNGYRKLMKDAVREYNLEQERLYQDAWGLYTVAVKQHAVEEETVRASAETLRQEAMREIANLRVRR